jgi:hypothetical protein
VREEHRVEARHRNHLGGVGGGQALDPEDRERHERVPVPPLVCDERREQRCGSPKPGDRATRTPADVGHLHKRVDEKEHSGRDQDGSERVEVLERRRAPFAADQPEGAAQQHHADGQVHPEHPAPAWPLREHAAEEDSDRRGETRHRAPGAERLVAVRALVKRRREDRERGRQHHRRAEALHEPGADEHAGAVGEPAGE